MTVFVLTDESIGEAQDMKLGRLRIES